MSVTLVCKKCPTNPPLELRGGNKLCCSICGTVYIEKFTEVSGKEVTNDEFTFVLEPKDILTVNVIRGDGSGMIPLLKRVIPAQLYIGGKKKIKNYTLKAKYTLAIQYEE